ncbi:MAG: sensor histidine kinase [Candidatus Omnitrophota bacterium]
MSALSKKIFINKRKRFLKKALVALTLSCVGFLAYSLIRLFGILGADTDSAFHVGLILLTMSAIAVAGYTPLDHFFTEFFGRYLFRKMSFVHMMLMNLAEELETVLQLQELGNLVVNTFGELLQLKTVALFVAGRQGPVFHVAAAYGWSVSDYTRARIADGSLIVHAIRESGPHVIVRDRLIKSLEWKEANLLEHDFDLLKANWVVPLWVGEELSGFLAFASEQPERVFEETDFRFFRKFAQAIAKKVKNAACYTELVQANQKLQDTQSKLVQVTKLAAIEQLATGIAHQIHNPLTIISGKAQVLLLQKDRLPLEERVEEVLKTIVKQTKRAADITKKLLIFSQGSSAEEGLNLGQILEETLALVSYQASLDYIEILKTVDPDMPPILANVHEVREMFFNLILNAVQAIESHGQIVVNLHYLTRQKTIELQVADTGRGMSPEEVSQLFNPFFTTREEAVGLGLFITKQIIHRMGGSIRAESKPGEGSLFIVQLPVKDKIFLERSAGPGNASPPAPEPRDKNPMSFEGGTR